MLRKIRRLTTHRGRNLWLLLNGSKWVGAGALIFDDTGRILLIRHRWRRAWEYPVGSSDGTESPLEAAQREVMEEVGLLPSNFQLLGVDFFHRRTPNGNLVFTFSATVDPQQAAVLKVDKFEATSHRWVTRAEAHELISDRLKPRLQVLLEAHDRGTAVYIESDRPIDSAQPMS